MGCYRITTERSKRQSGSTIVEFACAALPLFAFIFLYLNLAWVIFEWACVQEAVREGVRAAVTCTPTTALNTSIDGVIETYSFGFINAANVGSTVTIQYLDPSTLSPITTGTVTTGDVVKITISSLKVNIFAPVWSTVSPMYIGAVSADVIACRTPATP